MTLGKVIIIQIVLSTTQYGEKIYHLDNIVNHKVSINSSVKKPIEVKSVMSATREVHETECRIPVIVFFIYCEMQVC